MTKPKGVSLHIGLNLLDPAGYPLDESYTKWPNGWDGPLNGCEADAEAMESIARSQGFATEMMLTENATADNLKAAVADIAKTLRAGDIFLLTFAGHGGQVPDITGDESEDGDEFDTYDETWCMFDRHFIDDEHDVMLADFANDVRVLVVSDSCHSGTVLRGDFEEDDWDETRTMPRGTVHACYEGRKPFYDDLQRSLPRISRSDVGAKTLLFSACLENQTAGDGTPNGAFTGSLLRVWNDGKFEGDFNALHAQVDQELLKKYERDKEAHARGERKKKAKRQNPNLKVGNERDKALKAQRPFSI